MSTKGLSIEELKLDVQVIDGLVDGVVYVEMASEGWSAFEKLPASAEAAPAKNGMRESAGAEDDLSSLSPSDEDLQFLVGLDGGLVISDPLGGKGWAWLQGKCPMIDVLINLARPGKKK